MKRLLGFLVLAAATFGIITLVALEGGEVVVLETQTPDGTVRRTRTWVAEDAGSLWIEAANPERPFLVDLRRKPECLLVRGGTRLVCVATVLPPADGHTHVRQLLAARYGWADRWIGLLADTSRSAAVRFTCETRS